MITLNTNYNETTMPEQQAMIGDFEIAGLRAFKGHDRTTCLQGVLRKNGKKVAEWSEDAWNGPMHLRFLEPSLQAVFLAACAVHPLALTFIDNYTKSNGNAPPVTETYEDIVVLRLAQKMDLIKRRDAQVKRWCKTKTVVREADAPDGQYITYSIAYDPRLDARLMADHPGCEIINKRFR